MPLYEQILNSAGQSLTQGAGNVVPLWKKILQGAGTLYQGSPAQQFAQASRKYIEEPLYQRILEGQQRNFGLSQSQAERSLAKADIATNLVMGATSPLKVLKSVPLSLAKEASKNTVTLYRAAPKFPTDKFDKGTYFADSEQSARYYSESHYKGNPQDIKVQQFTLPKDQVFKEPSTGNYILKGEASVKSANPLLQEARKYSNKSQFMEKIANVDGKGKSTDEVYTLLKNAEKAWDSQGIGFGKDVIQDIPVGDIKLAERPLGMKPKAGRSINDPIEITYIDGKPTLVDGRHRLDQAIANGEKTIKAKVSGQSTDPLIAEARKYKTAEEFVNSKGSFFKRPFEDFKPTDTTEGLDRAKSVLARAENNGKKIYPLSKVEAITPDTEITVYRALRQGQEKSAIGDFVTPNKDAAESYLKNFPDRYSKVDSFQATIKDLRHDPNSTIGFVYSPKGFNPSQLTDIWQKANKP